MKWLTYTLLVLLLSVSVALLALPDPGYVLLAYGDYSVETSLVMLLAFLLATYLLIRLLAGLWRVPARVYHWDQRRRLSRDRRRLQRGMVELLEGNWPRAERRLLPLARSDETALIACLGAARAAQQQGQDKRRDHYLQLARQRSPDAELAIGLTQAELQMSAGQLPQAAATLTHLRTLAPRNPRVLSLLLSLYRDMHDWSRLSELLAEIRRRRLVGEDEYASLCLSTYRHLLERAFTERDLAALKETWAAVPRQVERDAGLLAVYVDYLLRLGADQDAEKAIRAGLRDAWNRRLVYLFGSLRSGDAAAQLAEAERWLQAHPDDPVLLLTLGRLSLRNQLWGKARQYLESSIRIQANAEAYQLLGELLEQLGENDKAAAAYRDGVRLALSDTRRGALPTPSP